VPAVTVENVDLAVPAPENYELVTERVDGVRLTVTELSGQAQAVPPRANLDGAASASI
jgi:hypothetical protein